jgi:hypothetical protein
MGTGWQYGFEILGTIVTTILFRFMMGVINSFGLFHTLRYFLFVNFSGLKH